MNLDITSFKSYLKYKESNIQVTTSINQIIESNELKFHSLVGTITDLQRVGNEAVGTIQDTTGNIRVCLDRSVLKNSLEVGSTVEIQNFSVLRVTKYSKFINLVPSNLKTIFPKNGEQETCLVSDDHSTFNQPCEVVTRKSDNEKIPTLMDSNPRGEVPTKSVNQRITAEPKIPIPHDSPKFKITEDLIDQITQPIEIQPKQLPIPVAPVSNQESEDDYLDAVMDMDFEEWDINPSKRSSTHPAEGLRLESPVSIHGDMDAGASKRLKQQQSPEKEYVADKAFQFGIDDESWLNEDIF